MNRDTRLLRWLPRFVVGSCGALAFTAVPAYAQRREPAATLMPARPALAPVVVRGATPDATLPSFTGTYVPAVAAAPNPKASWVGNKLTNLKDTVIGKPNPNPEARSPDPDPRLIGAPTNPLMGSGSQAQSQQPPQSVYATPPAYRWYGWGGTTPGANPHAPTGVYPQGSANWYSQTGATPGAFPVTMTKSTAESPSIEPPVYAGRINSEPGFEINVAVKPPESKPIPRYISGPPAPEPRVVARTPVGAPVAGYEYPVSPSLPSGTPVAIASSSSESRSVPAEPVAAPAPDLNWQTVNSRAGTVTKEPDPVPPPPMAPAPAPAETSWTPVRTNPAPKPPAPSVSVIRGIEYREPQSIEQVIRNSCVGRVIRTEVRAITPKKLVVTFVVGNENAARDAAALVANLPELKPYEVTFEAQVVQR